MFFEFVCPIDVFLLTKLFIARVLLGKSSKSKNSILQSIGHPYEQKRKENSILILEDPVDFLKVETHSQKSVAIL